MTRYVFGSCCLQPGVKNPILLLSQHSNKKLRDYQEMTWKKFKSFEPRLENSPLLKIFCWDFPSPLRASDFFLSKRQLSKMLFSCLNVTGDLRKGIPRDASSNGIGHLVFSFKRPHSQEGRYTIYSFCNRINL